MILFIDDEPWSIKPYVKEVMAQGLSYDMATTSPEAFAIIQQNLPDIECVVLDVIMPSDDGIDSALTQGGLYAGMPIYAAVRALLPEVPIVVLTRSLNQATAEWFRHQNRCYYFTKEVHPDQLAKFIRRLVKSHPHNYKRLLEELPPGIQHSRDYERLCCSILEYLFVPPMDKVRTQVRRQDTHSIRDIVITNSADTSFWRRLFQEFMARHIVFELKNYSDKVGKKEVQQLASYLRRRSIGRFGVLLSRHGPSHSAEVERRDVYSEQDTLILFLDDQDLIKMMELRESGRDPASHLLWKKSDFELSY